MARVQLQEQAGERFGIWVGRRCVGTIRQMRGKGAHWAWRLNFLDRDFAPFTGQATTFEEAEAAFAAEWHSYFERTAGELLAVHVDEAWPHHRVVAGAEDIGTICPYDDRGPGRPPRFMWHIGRVRTVPFSEMGFCDTVDDALGACADAWAALRRELQAGKKGPTSFRYDAGPIDEFDDECPLFRGKS